MYGNKRIGVVIPAFNEEQFIASVIDRIPGYIDRIYVVDDGSKDKTSEIAGKQALQKPGIIEVVKHQKNKGVGGAIVSGYRKCLKDQIDISVVMAGDNQMDPAQLPQLLEPIVEGRADYTVGDRISKRENMTGMSRFRRIGNIILRHATRLAAGNRKIGDPQNGYTALSHVLLNKLNLDEIYPGYGYCNDILIRLSAYGARILFVEMPAVYGNEKSKIRLWKYVPALSGILVRGYLWRIRKRHTNRRTVC